MVSVWSFDGFIIFATLFVCTCSYLARVPKLKSLVYKEKHGARGTLYKAAVLGIRLHWVVAIACVLLGVYKILL